MNIRTALPFVVLSCCLLLMVGCKKQAAFLVIDAETNKPLPRTLVDHNTLYEFPDENAGEPYLKQTYSLNEDGWVELHKPKQNDTYAFRMNGYPKLTVRMTEIGEKAEFMVVRGTRDIQWFELELRDEDENEGDIPTFIVPLKK